MLTSRHIALPKLRVVRGTFEIRETAERNPQSRTDEGHTFINRSTTRTAESHLAIRPQATPASRQFPPHIRRKPNPVRAFRRAYRKQWPGGFSMID